jgi:3-phosphoshikimate 1-carboxyvinyltransferase
MSEIKILPFTQPFHGTIQVPTDKSISHRAAILSSVADGNTRIDNFLESETTLATVNCLRQLGANIDEPNPNMLVVQGDGLHSLREPSDALFCAGSGTTMRLLSGLCAGKISSRFWMARGTQTASYGACCRAASLDGSDHSGADNGRLPPSLFGGNLHGSITICLS